MTWIAPDVSLPDQPLTGDDRPMLKGFLAWHRALLRRKCAGLTHLAPMYDPALGEDADFEDLDPARAG